MVKKNKRKRTELQSSENVEDKDEKQSSPKNKNNNKNNSSTSNNKNKQDLGSKPRKIAKKSGLEDIDDLFKSKKERVAEEKQKQEEEERIEMEKRKFFKSNASSSSAPSINKATKKSLVGDRTDTCLLKKNEWVNDGLGGVFDAEGFTGRKEEGVKVFKAHLFNKKGFGTTKDCPFDCDCCYI